MTTLELSAFLLYGEIRFGGDKEEIRIATSSIANDQGNLLILKSNY